MLMPTLWNFYFQEPMHTFIISGSLIWDKILPLVSLHSSQGERKVHDKMNTKLEEV